MSKKTCLTMFAAVMMAAFFAGCVPSDEQIQTEMALARREAYLEWKQQRASGYTKEARADGPLSVDDSIRLALQYNKKLQIAIVEREVTRGERLAAYSVILPSISVRGNAARIEKGRGNTDIDNYSMGLTVTQPIFEGENIPARLRTARLLTALTDEQIRDEVQNLIANVSSEYFDVLLAQHLVEVQREALVSAEAQFRMVSEKRKQETATDADVLRARSDVAKYQSQMIMEQNNIDTHRVNMLKYMGVSQDSQISFSDKLEFLPMRPVLERAVELASANRPDIRIAEIDARTAEEAVRIARSAFWPVIEGYVTTGWKDGWKHATGGGGSAGDAWGRNPVEGGINMSYYFGIDNVGQLQSARAQARQRQIEILDRMEVMLQEIRLQMNILNNAEEQVNALVVDQDSTREALRLVEVGYQAGVKTEVDVTDARKTLTEVMGQYYTALNNHTKARLNLQLAMGVLGPTCISDGPPTPPGVPIANIQEFAATDYVPPAPLVMPTSERPAPAPRDRTVRERSRGGATEQDKPESSLPTPRRARPIADEQPNPVAPTPAPMAVAPAPVPVAAAPARSADALALPPPPASSSGSSLKPPAPARREEPVPVQAALPAPKAAQPLFKITVREGGSDMPEIARLGQ